MILPTFLRLEASFSKTNGKNRKKIPDPRLLLYFRAKQLKTIPNVRPYGVKNQTFEAPNTHIADVIDIEVFAC